jgi:hypothetical protein
MATLEPEYALRKLMVDDGTVAGLVSTRIYPLFNVPQNTKLPYITYYRSGDSHVYHLLGESGLIQADIELDIFATTDSSMRSLADAVRLAIAGVTGTVTVGSDSVVLLETHIKNTFDGTDPPPDGSSTPVFQRVMNVKVGYRVTANT